MSVENDRALPTIDDLLAFNRQLVGLVKAGVQVDLGNGGPSDQIVNEDQIASELAQISSRVALEVSRGRTVEDALRFDPQTPVNYRAAWETWFHGKQPIEALNALTSPAEARAELRGNIGSSLVQALVVLSLVYCGFIYLVLVAARQLESTYAQMGESPGASLRFLIAAREWLPVWGVVVPVAVLLATLYWWRNAARWRYRWVPGRAHFSEAITKANYSENVARLLETDHSLGRSLQLVGPTNEPANSPSMLRWGFAAQADDALRAVLLRFTARVYRDSARGDRARWRAWIPVALGTLVGGVMVLGYGVSLFAPMVELLMTLTKP